MAEDSFEIWLGHIGKDPGLRASLRRVVNLAGGLRAPRSRMRRFSGARIGRGSAVGALLSATAGRSGRGARRVVVKARILKLAGKGAQAAAAHLRYLQRDGTTRTGERGMLYGSEVDVADGKAFLERGAGDRHQFRFILSAEDGAQYDDLRPLVRRWMAQVETDLGTRLDWVAVDHFNTGHPHSHVVVRGKDDLGKDLVIARAYLTEGLRERAAELVNLDLGPRSKAEIAASNRREIAQERFTGIDRRLLRSVNGDGLVAPHHRDGVEQSLRAGRIGMLVRMGLAKQVARGRWRLDADLERTLRAMGKRGDIVATLDRVARDRGMNVPPSGYAIYEPADARSKPVVGRVVAKGLAEHDEDRSYLIVDGIDGQAHYIDTGVDDDHGPAFGSGAIVRVAPVAVEARAVDRTVADIAQAHGGVYSAELHALHDPSASERYIAAHVRRLEAMRRTAGVAERGADGLWRIAPDHCERALAYERARARAQPVTIEVLASHPLEQLARHDGITALDEDRDLADETRLGGGFGRKVADALARRRQWLSEQGLAGTPDARDVLRRRELVRVAARLSRELGLGFVETADGDRVQGVYRRSAQVGALRMAVIEDGGGGFALVPWRRTLERQLGREVSGMVRGGAVSWSFGRQRAGPER
jgi:type IV secretory pathway VirD2 relaxase